MWGIVDIVVHNVVHDLLGKLSTHYFSGLYKCFTPSYSHEMTLTIFKVIFITVSAIFTIRISFVKLLDI